MSTNPWESLLNLSPEQAQQREREWNRGPITDLFPRIPPQTLERILDLCASKGVTYNLSEPKNWSARRFTSIVIAHVRHAFSNYDKLLREEGKERYEARHATAETVWKVLREWCPWDSSNGVLERCFRATLLRPEECGGDWDPMDVDEESDVDGDVGELAGGDPMALD